MSHTVFIKRTSLESDVTPFCLGGGLFGIKVVKNILHIDADVTCIEPYCFTEEAIKKIIPGGNKIDTICFHSWVYLSKHSITSSSIKKLIFLESFECSKETFLDSKMNKCGNYIIYTNTKLAHMSYLNDICSELDIKILDINNFKKRLEVNNYYNQDYVNSIKAGHFIDTFESDTYREDWLDFIKFDNQANKLCLIELIMHKLKLMINYFEKDNNSLNDGKINNMKIVYNLGKSVLNATCSEDRKFHSESFFESLALNWHEW